MYLHRHIHIVKICSIDVISSVRYVLKSPDLFTAMQIGGGQVNALEELVDMTRALVQKHLHTRALGRGGVEYALYSPVGCAVGHGSARPLPLEPPCNRVLVFLLLTTFGAIYAETWERSASPPRLPV